MKNDEGYTLIELSVALAMSGVVIALAYSAFSFAGRLIAEWQDRVDAEARMHVFVDRLSTDILESTAILQRGHGWIAYNPAGDSTVYSVNRRSILRDSLEILSGDSVAFEISAPQVGGSDFTRASTVRINVMMTSARGFQIERAVYIRPRHRSEWPRSSGHVE